MKEIFQTERLFIRLLQGSDSDAFYDMQSNLNVMRYIKKTMNQAESNQELARFMSYYMNSDIDFNIWAVVQSDTQEFIGICGVYENPENEFEIAYRLREKFWGRGYGAETAKGLIRYCQQELNIIQLVAYARAGNTGSISILEREMSFVKECCSEKTGYVERKYRHKAD